ncbi:hypothetical protein AVL48_37460 [Amycolatopsis regifaucium]|uniref:Uncharacterized protein n=1 Tax=Amycolatopsis regifaucium TaxID=546365 RepID=A0A154MH52_9PSEU|nr:hypothetical protein AVL48_37460 [Amycolatopsis regifaucium]OKA03777.1 hypothetical protein ATP06_0234645 [Amycolatopsis regifaucium]SFJ60342.1 hypothetical protein SAMN04489731_12627 [Amycolatopsis regifaucium]
MLLLDLDMDEDRAPVDRTQRQARLAEDRATQTKLNDADPRKNRWRHDDQSHAVLVHGGFHDLPLDSGVDHRPDTTGTGQRVAGLAEPFRCPIVL